VLQVALQAVPVQVGVPFATAGHGVHELPQVATLLLVVLTLVVGQVVQAPPQRR
jgi:hypothetical protein